MILGAIGILTVIVTWEVLGRTGALGRTWPPLTDVLDTLTDPARRELFERAVSATLSATVRGFVYGSVLGFAMAALGVVVPLLRPGLDRLAAVLNAVPLIALGPFLIVTLSREGTPTAIATLAVFFNVFVASAAGFASARGAHRDVFSVLGSRRWATFWRLELPAALPSVADGLKLGAPAAVLGAILGEWFGAPRGLGILIVSSMQNYQITLLWSAALIGAVMSLVAFAAFGALEMWVSARFR